MEPFLALDENCDRLPDDVNQSNKPYCLGAADIFQISTRLMIIALPEGGEGFVIMTKDRKSSSGYSTRRVRRRLRATTSRFGSTGAPASSTTTRAASVT
jgi:hypothetical protein